MFLKIITTIISLISWHQVISITVSTSESARLEKRLKYESMRPHHMEKHISRDSFVRRARASEDAMHEVVIAIRQQNLDALKDEVLARSTPGHAQYQRWLSFEEVGNMVQNEEAYGAVMEWLEAYDVEVTWSSPYHEYIRASGRIGEWERMLSTEFYEFEDLSHRVGGKESGVKFHRALEYSIPSELKESVEAIFHTVQTPPAFKENYLSRIPRQKAKSIYPYEDTAYKTHLRVDHPSSASLTPLSTSSGKLHTEQIGNDVTVSFLNKLYKVSSNLASPRLNQSVFQTNTEKYNPADLTDFQQSYGLTIQSPSTIGGNRATSSCSSNGNSCSEGNLDLMYLMGMAQRTATIFWYVVPIGDPFVTWVQDASASKYPPQSNSISWGETETLMSISTVNAFETEAMKLAGRGVTILVASGDDGAPGVSSSNVCLCSGRTLANSASSTGYNPSFPATSQWVTALGATMGPETGKAEVVCSSSTNGVITSGGGFSSKISRPSWQSKALDYYFNLATKGSNPPSAGYNAGGRGYPDLSYIGVNYRVLIDGDSYSVYGTSASAPVFAAFVTLVNSARYAENKPAIGFINPTLYAVGYNFTLGKKTLANATFTDVTSGNNKCCKSSLGGKCCQAGFTAVKGWDPTTGWGSMDYTHFSALFEVAATFTPPSSGNSNNSSKPALNAVGVGIIVIVIAVVLMIGAVLFVYLAKWCRGTNQSRPPRETEFAVINTHDSAAVPVSTMASPPSGRAATYAMVQTQHENF